MSEPAITAELVQKHNLTPDEYELVKQILGREPTYTELGIFSVMWSEHCSYKSSRKILARLPTKGSEVILGPGEDAGVVHLGTHEGVRYALVIGHESHNHPSQVLPVEGAATAVGGILRDIFPMGARPVASLNSLRFGDPGHPRTRYLVGGDLLFDGGVVLTY